MCLGVDRIAHVVAGTIGDMRDLQGIGPSVCTRFETVEDSADRVNHLDIPLFGVSANGVRQSD